MYFAIGYGLGELAVHAIEKFRDRVSRTTTYDPVYDVISQNRAEIAEGIGSAAQFTYENRAHVVSAAGYAAARASPFIGAVNLFYDIYRFTMFVDEKYPGYWRDFYEDFIDSAKFHTGIYPSESEYYDPSKWVAQFEYETGRPASEFY